MSLPSGMKEQKTGPDGMPALGTLYFYLTEGCNLACRHCWIAPKLDTSANRYPVLPVELFEAAIREAKPLGLSGVKLTGGDAVGVSEESVLKIAATKPSQVLVFDLN